MAFKTRWLGYRLVSRLPSIVCAFFSYLLSCTFLVYSWQWLIVLIVPIAAYFGFKTNKGSPCNIFKVYSYLNRYVHQAWPDSVLQNHTYSQGSCCTAYSLWLTCNIPSLVWVGHKKGWTQVNYPAPNTGCVFLRVLLLVLMSVFEGDQKVQWPTSNLTLR